MNFEQANQIIEQLVAIKSALTNLGMVLAFGWSGLTFTLIGSRIGPFARRRR